MSHRKSRLKTLLTLIEAYPPFLVIAVAKRKLDINKIASVSGIPLRTMFRLSRLTSNRNVKIGTLSVLWETCGFDPFCPSENRGVQYIQANLKRGQPMPHLSKREWNTFCQRAERAMKERQAS